MIHLLNSTAHLHSTMQAPQSESSNKPARAKGLHVPEVDLGTRKSQQGAAQCAAGKVQAAINYMTAHLNRPLRISTLTALTGLSASHFFVLFKAATGATPLKYFLRLRMRLACKLLGDRSLSVKEIAFFLDYGDPLYFSRIFKQINGFAPSHYRSRILDAQPEKASAVAQQSRG